MSGIRVNVLALTASMLAASCAHVSTAGLPPADAARVKADDDVRNGGLEGAALGAVVGGAAGLTVGVGASGLAAERILGNDREAGPFIVLAGTVGGAIGVVGGILSGALGGDAIGTSIADAQCRPAQGAE